MVIITSTFLPIQINTCTIKTYKYTNYCINLHFIRMKLTKNAKILHLHLLGLNLLTDIVDFPFSQWFFDWRDNFYYYDWSHPFFLWLLTFYTVFILTKTNLATYILFSPTNCIVRPISFAAQLEFPKMLVPRLHQNASNVNIESTIKIKTTILFMLPIYWSPDIS